MTYFMLFVVVVVVVLLFFFIIKNPKKKLHANTKQRHSKPNNMSYSQGR
jgi:preprotein translocase subunit YajC